MRGTIDAVVFMYGSCSFTLGTQHAFKVGLCYTSKCHFCLFLNGNEQNCLKSVLSPVSFSSKKFIFLSNLNLFWVIFVFLRVCVVDVTQYLSFSYPNVLEPLRQCSSINKQSLVMWEHPTSSFGALQLRYVF